MDNLRSMWAMLINSGKSRLERKKKKKRTSNLKLQLLIISNKYIEKNLDGYIKTTRTFVNHIPS